MQERGAAESPPLRVGVLADTIDRPGGIGRYTSELVAALGRRDDVRLIVAAPASAADRVRRLAGDHLLSMLNIPGAGQLGIALWERHAIGPQFAKAGAQIVHGTKHLVPRTPLPTVLTVHDLMTITRAHESSFAKRMFLPHQYWTSLDQATGLIAASEATRDRLRDLNSAWDEKTVVAPNGLSRNLIETGDKPVAGLVDTRFALVVGDLAPRKNVKMLLDLWPAVAQAAPGFRLVVLGHPGPHSDETTALLAQLEAAGIAVWLRGADDAALRWCYEHATVVLFPTLEEGFGFPLLEALTFHAPVIASTDPALIEVAAGSDEVVHLDATARDAWLDEITAAATRPRAPVRLPEPPPSALTWEENAEILVSLYRRLLPA
jgi:glycosyltransferase involved in cell wall biosynthesis